MSAHTRLNVAYFNGCLVAAAVVGWLVQSWAVSLAALAVTLG